MAINEAKNAVWLAKDQVHQNNDIWSIVQANNKVTLKATCTDKFLSAQPNGSIQCNRDKAAAWEVFKPVRHEGGFALFSEAHKKYLTVKENGEVRCDASGIGG